MKIFIVKIERISLMADVAKAITNGIEESGITIIIRGMCWFHCKKSVDKHIVKIKAKDKRSAIITSIISLQLCQTPDIFKAATKLFLNEYLFDVDEDVRIFINYFKENWHEGYNHPNNAG